MSRFEMFLQTLPVMLYGMLGIFVVMLVIYGLTAAFSKMTAGQGEE